MRIAQFAIKSRICCSHSRQLLLKPVTCRSVGYGTSPAGYHGYDSCDRNVVHKDTDAEHSPVPWHKVVCASDAVAEKHVSENLRLYEDFISEDEKKCLFDEVEPYLRRLKYEDDHWDDAIVGYRETEKRDWNGQNRAVLQRVRTLAFAADVPQLDYVHVLDVLADGVIRPHIDSTRYCGATIAALCLLSDAVMRLTHHVNKAHFADILLRRRSLYIMQGEARYEYTHELLPSEQSIFNGEKVERSRRISVICRAEPLPRGTDS